MAVLRRNKFAGGVAYRQRDRQGGIITLTAQFTAAVHAPCKEALETAPFQVGVRH